MWPWRVIGVIIINDMNREYYIIKCNISYPYIYKWMYQDFQGIHLSSRAFKKLHVQYTSDKYRTLIGLRLRYEPVPNYSISISIEFFFLKIFYVCVSILPCQPYIYYFEISVRVCLHITMTTNYILFWNFRWNVLYINGCYGDM